MAEPRLKILGVFRPTITEELFAEQNEMYGDVAATQEHFAGLVLIEAVIDGIDERIDAMIDLTQETPKGGQQAAYSEALLSPDGETVLKRQIGCVKGKPPLRCAFYMHYFDPNQPLRWPYGEVACPPLQPAPTRLHKLMPYWPTD
jgi:hypothetical protein